MKKIIILFLVVVQFATATNKDSLVDIHQFKKYYTVIDDDDCDACGCSASGGSMGFASMLNSNFVGIRYFNQSYKSSDGLYSNSLWYDENYNTTQVWARIPLVKNIQVSTLIPFHFHNRETENGKQKINGLGDITVLGMYRLYQTHKDSTIFVHTLQIGAGIKLPTGKFNETNSGNVNPSYQVGTGSWDYILATEYVVKRKKFGLNTMANYTIKTENQKSYRFGNQLNAASTLFYLYEKNKFSYAPQIGLAYEKYETNYQYGQKVRNTSGTVFFNKIGFELGKEKLSFGTNFMLPISQNLTGNRVKANYRWMINLNYSL